MVSDTFCSFNISWHSDINFGLGYTAKFDIKLVYSFFVEIVSCPFNHALSLIFLVCSLGIFSLMAFLSILVFIFKNRNLIIIAKSFAPSGFVFTLIALVTGSIWGKPTWGTWWAWDARITTMLILGLFYLMYLLAWRIFEDRNSVVKITSLISIIGAINIPIIKFSVDWWNTLHQPSSIKILSDSSIHEAMLLPLIIMTAAFALFSLLIFLMKYNTELIKIKRKGLNRL